jgi:intein/homing endonuclease
MELAEIVTDLITDGHLEVRRLGTRSKYDYIAFFSKEQSELKRFGDLIYKNFGIKGKIREWGSDKRISYILSNAGVVRYLLKAGVTAGSKVSTDFVVPPWVLEEDRRIIRVFIRRCFTCDGSILYDKDRKRWIIHFTTHKELSLIESGEKYLEQLRKLLRSFRIKSSNITTSDRYIRSRDREKIVGLRFKIYDMHSIINYARYIGFDLNYKNARLKKAVLWAEN